MKQISFKKKGILLVLGILLLSLMLSVYNKGFLSLGQGDFFIVNISIFMVLVGGFLAFLSPCAGFIIPASTFFILSKNKFKTFLYFYLGFIVIFIPLIFAGSIIALLFIPYTEYFFVIAAMLLFTLAIIGFSSKKCSANFMHAPDDSYKTSFLMGVSYSFTSIACSGPILGAIITLSYARGLYLIYPFILALLFAFGMLLPVLILGYIPLSKRIYSRLNKKTINIKIFIFVREINYLQFLRNSSLIVSGVILLFFKNIDSSIYIQVTSYLYDKLSYTSSNVLLILILFTIIFVILIKKTNLLKRISIKPSYKK